MAGKHQPPGRCKHTGCDRDAIKGAYFCTLHINVKRQCRAKSKATGERCKRRAMTGLVVCERHGGQFPNSKKVSEKTKALTAMQRFVRPFEGDVDPIGVFEMEFRRCLGRIAWLDDQISALDTEDLIWGMTKEERVMAAETPGTNKTYEARVNLLVEMQNWERKHLLDMEKVWIAAKLDTERLSLMRKYVETTYTAVVKALTLLGLDPASEEVQNALQTALLGDKETSNGIPALPPINED